MTLGTNEGAVERRRRERKKIERERGREREREERTSTAAPRAGVLALRLAERDGGEGAIRGERGGEKREREID